MLFLYIYICICISVYIYILRECVVVFMRGLHDFDSVVFGVFWLVRGGEEVVANCSEVAPV